MTNQAPYTVVWSASAAADLDAIITYIAHTSPSSALITLKKIQAQSEVLYQNPQRGRVVPELHQQNITFIREIVLSPWRIMFKIGVERVEVLAVIDSRRDFNSLLLQRILR